jgi:hypothetical protein
MMRPTMRPMIVPLAVTLLMSIFALAQEQPKPGSADQGRQTWAASGKALTVSGKVSNDGKRFLTDIDTEWAINNTEAVKGREGRLITIKCYVDPDKGRIQVLSVKTDAQYTAMYGDSAFRR